MNTLIVRTQHNEKLYLAEEGMNRYVAIKPICEDLGIAFRKQHDKIKSHPMFSSVVTLRVITASDKKGYETTCLPLMFAMIWLGSINASNTKNPQLTLEMQLRYIKALYDSIEKPRLFLADKKMKVEKLHQQRTALKKEFNATKSALSNVEKEFDKELNKTMQEWEEEKAQQLLEFPEE